MTLGPQVFWQIEPLCPSSRGSKSIQVIGCKVSDDMPIKCLEVHPSFLHETEPQVLSPAYPQWRPSVSSNVEAHFSRFYCELALGSQLKNRGPLTTPIGADSAELHSPPPEQPSTWVCKPSFLSSLRSLLNRCLPRAANPGTFSIISAIGRVARTSLVISSTRAFRAPRFTLGLVNDENPWHGGHPAKRESSHLLLLPTTFPVTCLISF